MNAHSLNTKTFAKTIDATIESLMSTFRDLPRLLRGARKTAGMFGRAAVCHARGLMKRFV